MVVKLYENPAQAQAQVGPAPPPPRQSQRRYFLEFLISLGQCTDDLERYVDSAVRGTDADPSALNPAAASPPRTPDTPSLSQPVQERCHDLKK